MSRKENLAAARARRKETGLCSVYIRHDVGFHGRLRPAHDSAPTSHRYPSARFTSAITSEVTPPPRASRIACL